HVIAVGGGAVADDLGVDVGAPGEGVFQLLHHHAAGAAGHHEAIAVGVVGAGGQFRRVVVLGGQGAHGVEHAGHGPVLLLGAAGEEDVLLAELDLLHRGADAVGAGGAGGGDGKIETLDLEGGGETGGDGARHDLGDPVGAGALDALLPYHVDGFDEFLPGYAAGAHDDAGAGVGYLLGLQGRVLDGPLHGDVGVGGGIAHEAQVLAVDELGGVQVDLAGDVAAQAHFPVGLLEADAGTPGAQCLGDGLLVMAYAGNHAHSSDNGTSHGGLLEMAGAVALACQCTQYVQKLSVEVNSPTRRSLALYISRPSTSTEPSEMAITSLRSMMREMSRR